jgi:DNA-binding beta-propeller fold protein YncE
MRKRAFAGLAGGVAAMMIVATASAAPSGSLRPVEEFLSGAMSNASGVTVSPDGDHVYGVGFASNDILTLNRNANTGAVTFEDITIGDPDGLNAPNSIAISGDGDNAYVAGNFSDSLHAFARSPADGQLSHIDVAFDDADGVTALGGAYDVAVAGPHVYVTGSDQDGVVVFNRDGDGELSFADEFVDGSEGIQNMDQPRGIAISPNGRSVYVASAGDGAIVTFRRFPATGQLDFVESDTGFLAPGEDVAVSRDGARVYGGFDNGVATLRRNPSTGALTNLGMTVDDPLGVFGLAVTPDGGNVYATRDLITDGVATLRTRRSGRAVFSRLNEFEDFTEPFGVVASADGRHVYVSGGTTGDGHIAAFSRQHAVELKGKRKQKASKLAVKAECSADCTVAVTGKGLRRATKQLKAGRPQRIRLKPKGGGPNGNKVTVKSRAKAGNRIDADKLKVTLK